ncbi:MAG: SlyX family protein [Methyloprofundus sp.]|nr:SlyX family protein [Methyloprofundus sp.]
MSDQRLIELESKMAYQDDTILQLNDVLCKQQDQIDRLEELTQQLLARVRDLSDNSSGGPAGFSAADERPPHY